MLTLNELVKKLNNLQLNHAQLSNGAFLFGDQHEFGASGKITYPLMGVTLNNSIIEGKMFMTSFTVVFCDLVHKDEQNETEVLSDMHSIALDVYAQLKYDLEDAYPATVSVTAPLTDFTERFDDEVTGWEIDITIEQAYTKDTCSVPDSGANAGKVLIKDQNGNTLATLNPGSTYVVTVWDGIDEGDSDTVYTDGITDE